MTEPDPAGATSVPTPPPAKPAPPTARPVPLDPTTYPELDAPGPSSAGTAVAVVLLVVVILLVAVMVTGINEQIPYLHPSSGASQQVTVYGDRLTYDYEFVANGTLQNVTTGYICSQCPLTLATGASFTLQITVSNPNNATEEVNRFSTQTPFALLSVSPGSAVPIAAGLSEAFTLTLAAPATVGTYVAPITASINVS